MIDRILNDLLVTHQRNPVFLEILFYLDGFKTLPLSKLDVIGKPRLGVESHVIAVGKAVEGIKALIVGKDDDQVRLMNQL